MSSIFLRRTVLALTLLVGFVALVGLPSLASAEGMSIDPNGAHAAVAAMGR
jgi:hypothetical protein